MPEYQCAVLPNQAAIKPKMKPIAMLSMMMAASQGAGVLKWAPHSLLDFFRICSCHLSMESRLPLLNLLYPIWSLDLGNGSLVWWRPFHGEMGLRAAFEGLSFTS